MADISVEQQLAQIEAIDLADHKRRMQIITEVLTAKALTRLIEGKISMDEWNAFEQVLATTAAAADAAALTAAKLAAGAVDPAKITAATAKMQAIATTLNGIVAQATVNGGTPPAS